MSWRESLLELLAIARLGAQFPDAARWRSLLELLGRDGPRGKPLSVVRSPLSGLPAPRSLAHFHKLQFVAREWFKAHRKRPTAQARAFSMALAALELPPVEVTHARVMTAGRFLVVHERSDVKFTAVLERSPLSVGRDQLARVPDGFLKTLRRACAGTATEAFVALSQHAEVREVVRGQLGPFIDGPSPADAPADVRALASVGTPVLSVSLERIGVEVTAPSMRDPWRGAEPPVPGAHLACERRLFCRPALEPALKTLTRGTVLVRSR